MHTHRPTHSRALLLIIATLLLTLLTAACSKDAGAGLASHVDKIASIAEDNKDKPADAIDALHKYLQDNLPSILKEVAALAVRYDKASSDDERKKVMEEVEKSLKEPVEKAMKAFEPLMKKVGSDADAQKKIAEIQKKFEMIGGALASIQ